MEPSINPSVAELRPLIRAAAAYRTAHALERAYFERCHAVEVGIALPGRDASDAELDAYAVACRKARRAVGLSLDRLTALHTDTVRRVTSLAAMTRRVFGEAMFAGASDRDVVDCVERALERSLAPAAANATS